MKKLRITQKDSILAAKRADREDEICLHGKQIIFRHAVHVSKKRYNRKHIAKPTNKD